jgi:deferrochelatase/peroxidase EfeB
VSLTTVVLLYKTGLIVLIKENEQDLNRYLNPSTIKNLMPRQVQKGIYFDNKRPYLGAKLIDENNRSSLNRTFAILFLRVAEGRTSIEVGESLMKLWHMYKDLEKGKVTDLPNTVLPTGGLTVLIGYGPDIFKVPNIRKNLPNDLRGRQFLPPGEGGGPILKGSGIKYALDIHENVGISEHVVFQFISDTQLATYRAIVETMKHLASIDSKNRTLYLTKFYTGFQRDDLRSWLGFHDEVSNMKNAKEREDAIRIDVANNKLEHSDYWTRGGTYLAFLRIEIDLGIWEKMDRKSQELIIGRNKLTGYPLIGVDGKGNPVSNQGCPSWQRSMMRHKYEDHPDYFKKPVVTNQRLNPLDMEASLRILSQSHIGRTRHIDKIDSREVTSRRIFRQSFEFLEPLPGNISKPLRTGLNFVSFQNDPGRLFFILTDPNWMGNVNFGGNPNMNGMDRLLSVLAAGVFFVHSQEAFFSPVRLCHRLRPYNRHLVLLFQIVFYISQGPRILSICNNRQSEK